MHQFFQHINMGNSPIQNTDLTPELNHNNMVLEISNNWPWAKWLMCKYREGWLKKIDTIEQDWYNFMINNGIDIETYKNEEEFIEKNLKSLGKE